MRSLKPCKGLDLVSNRAINPLKLYHVAFGLVLAAVLLLQALYGPGILVFVGVVGLLIVSSVVVFENKQIKKRKLTRLQRISETRFKLDPQLRMQDGCIRARVSITGKHRIEKLTLAASVTVTDAGVQEGEIRLTGTLPLLPYVTFEGDLTPGSVHDITICATRPEPSLSLPVDREPELDGFRYANLRSQVEQDGRWIDYIKSNPSFAFLECAPKGEFSEDVLAQTARLSFN